MIWQFCSDLQWRLPEKDSNLLQVGKKSVRFNPGNAALWSNYFRIAVSSLSASSSRDIAFAELSRQCFLEQEKLGQGSDGVEGLFARAMATQLFESDMDTVVTLYHARAAFHRREVDASGKFSSSPRFSPLRNSMNWFLVPFEGSEEEGPNIDLVGLVLGVLQEGIAKTKQSESILPRLISPWTT